MSAAPSLSQQIAALNGEIAVRKRELQKAVSDGRTRQSEADYVVASLEAIGDTLRRLDARRDQINQRTFNGDVAPVGGCW